MSSPKMRRICLWKQRQKTALSKWKECSRHSRSRVAHSTACQKCKFEKRALFPLKRHGGAFRNHACVCVRRVDFLCMRRSCKRVDATAHSVLRKGNSWKNPLGSGGAFSLWLGCGLCFCIAVACRSRRNARVKPWVKKKKRPFRFQKSVNGLIGNYRTSCCACHIVVGLTDDDLKWEGKEECVSISVSG